MSDRPHLSVPRGRRLPRITAGIVLLLTVLTLAATCRPPLPPGRGVVEFGGNASSQALDNPDALGINPLINWADLEPEEGAYDWSRLDDALAAAHAKGKRVVPRVYTNVGHYGQATPQWVFDAGARPYYWSSDSTTVQPVPTDPVFRDKFASFLVVLGRRYDGNPDIEFFQTNAGMGGYGEMVWSYYQTPPPPGWSAQVEVDTVAFWIDRWRDAFPHTNLAVTINPIGKRIAASIAQYAVGKGFYLQSNTPDQSSEAVDVFTQHAANTKIVLEIENSGCISATGTDFDDLLAKVFSYGFPIDYLSVCGETFSEPDHVRSALDRLRAGAVE